MTPKTFISLGAAALVSLIAAGAVHSISSPWRTDLNANARVLPGLADRLGEVAALRVRQSGRELSIIRDGERWILEHHAGFPADPAKVRQNLVGLGELRRIEPKTRRPERYPAIEVEDPDREGAKSRHVEVLAENGEALARLIVGKARKRVLGTSEGGVYLREDGSDQAWLASGDLSLSAGLDDWLDTGMMSLTVGGIDRLTITREPAFPLELNRVPGENRGFRLKALPEGMTAKSEFALQNEVRKVTRVTFDDVRAAGDRGEPAARMRLEGANGLDLDFELRRADDGGRWVRVSASGDGKAAKADAVKINERFSGFELHLGPEASDAFTVTLGDVVDVEAS
jgi:hypothetical protein